MTHWDEDNVCSRYPLAWGKAHADASQGGDGMGFPGWPGKGHLAEGAGPGVISTAHIQHTPSSFLLAGR